MIIGHCRLEMEAGRIYLKPVQLDKKVNFYLKRKERKKNHQIAAVLSAKDVLWFAYNKDQILHYWSVEPLPAILVPLLFTYSAGLLLLSSFFLFLFF